MEIVSRRGLLKALSSFFGESKQRREEIIRIRPPYTDESSDFYICKSCNGFCITSCKEGILFKDENGIPYVEFKNSGCTFCKECLNACKYGVLKNHENRKIYAITTINQNICLAWNKTMCFSCRDYCTEDAIEFTGLFNPKIITLKCINCGFCLISCPVNAIHMERDNGST